MKLAVCHPVVDPRRGGSGTYISMLLHRLCQDGHDVHLFASRHDPSALPSLPIHPVPEYRWPRILRPWRYSAACRNAMAERRFDLSIGFDKVAGVDVLYPLGGLHMASITHGGNRFANPWFRRLANAFRRLDPSHVSMSAFERTQYLGKHRPFPIAISEFVRSHFPCFLGIPPDGIPVLYPAINPERLAATDRPARRDRTRRQWGLDPSHVLGLFAGFNPRLKGLAPLLHAVARMRNSTSFRLGVISLPDPGPYRLLARRLRIEEKVLFLGYQPDIRDAYFAADLLVHPTFYDPCSLVVLEAQAVGLPVITTEANGASERLNPPMDGVVIETAHDTEAFAAALDEMLDADRRRACGRAALKSAARWTFDDHYREFIRLLGVALSRKQAA